MHSRVLLALFGLSIATNVALGYFVFRRVEGGGRSIEAKDIQVREANRASHSANAPALGRLGEKISTARTPADFRELADDLRDAGWPSDVVTQLVRALVGQNFTRRRQEIYDWSAAPFWRDSQPTEGQQAALRALDREQREFLLALNLPRTQPEQFIRRRQYSDLSDEKIAALEKIFRDSGDLRQELQANLRNSGGRNGKEVEAQGRLLEAEMQRDIEALLTPEEKAEYDFRRSGDFGFLRSQLRGIEVSEQEFRTLYAAQKAFRATQPGMSLEPASESQLMAWDDWQKQVRATLGDDRYRAFTAAQLGPSAPQFFAERPAITSAQVQALARLQRTVPFELQKEMLAPNLTGEERQARLAAVNERVRAQLTEILGPQVAAEAIAKNVLRFMSGGG